MAKNKSQTGLGAILGYTNIKNDPADLARQQEANYFDLFAILPDPSQPRSLLPADLYQALWEGEEPTNILEAWIERTAEDFASPAQKQAVAELEQLAATIEIHGLIHPINVREASEAKEVVTPPGISQLIVTGERRWWAHVLLVAKDKKVAGERNPQKIQAVLLPAGIKVRALQLIENMQRAGLTAIERAEGLEELRQELSEGLTAPVAWVEVERTLGINKVYRWRIQQVLNLCQEAIDLIRWYGLTEKAIRPIAEKLQDKPELQLIALNQLVAWQGANEDAGNKRLLDFISRLLQNQGKEQNLAESAGNSPSQLTQTFGRRAETALKVINHLDEATLEQIALMVAQDEKVATSLLRLRDKLDYILKH